MLYRAAESAFALPLTWIASATELRLCAELMATNARWRQCLSHRPTERCEWGQASGGGVPVLGQSPLESRMGTEQRGSVQRVSHGGGKLAAQLALGFKG